MLYGGELVGFSWTKNASNRSVILQCEDWSNYWDYAMQSDNTDIFGPGLKAVFSGASTNLFTDFLSSKGTVLTQILVSGKCNTFPKLKGLAAGLIRLMEAVGGSYYVFPDPSSNQPPKRYAGQNVFFSYNELRLHITQMVGTPAPDPTSEQIMQYQGYSGMFDRVLGAQGGQVSIRHAINAISQIIFYEMYPQPCPKYTPGLYGSVSGTKKMRLVDNPQYKSLGTSANNLALGLDAVLGTIQAFGSGPSDPDAYSAALQTLAANASSVLTDIRRSALQVRTQMAGVPEPAPSSLSTAVQMVGQAMSSANSLLKGGSQGSSSATLATLKQQVTRPR